MPATGFTIPADAAIAFLTISKAMMITNVKEKETRSQKSKRLQVVASGIASTYNSRGHKLILEIAQIVNDI